MDNRGKHTLEEILSQTRAWEQAHDVVEREGQALDALGRGDEARQFIFTGCGSTYYLALAAAAHLRSIAHRRAQGVPASELWLDGDSYWRDGDPLIAISRSGTTTETLRVVDAYCSSMRRRQSAVTIGCEGESPLAMRGEVNLVISQGAEKSIAQTRSFAGMFVAAVAMNARLAGRGDLGAALSRMPLIGERVLESAQGLGQRWGKRLDLDRIYFLGSGTRYGLACEASLKMKEMSLSHSEPFHFLEFRHGPKSMITETTLVVGLVSERLREQETRVLEEAAALGARTIVLGERAEQIGQGAAISFESGLPGEVRDVMYLAPLQMLAFERAIAKGLDPDRPRHLDAVVQLQ
jgi:glutamine---fructose-6-phosphate transaminase (isomerizing)